MDVDACRGAAGFPQFPREVIANRKERVTPFEQFFVYRRTALLHKSCQIVATKRGKDLCIHDLLEVDQTFPNGPVLAMDNVVILPHERFQQKKMVQRSVNAVFSELKTS